MGPRLPNITNAEWTFFSACVTCNRDAKGEQCSLGSKESYDARTGQGDTVLFSPAGAKIRSEIELVRWQEESAARDREVARPKFNGRTSRMPEAAAF